MLRALCSWIVTLTLLGSLALLGADVLYGYRTPLGSPSLAVLCVALAGMALALRRSRQKLFFKALDEFVQRETLRDLRGQLAHARSRQRDDSTPSHQIATMV